MLLLQNASVCTRCVGYYPNIYAVYTDKRVDITFLKQYHRAIKKVPIGFFFTLVEYGVLAFCWKQNQDYRSDI